MEVKTSMKNMVRIKCIMKFEGIFFVEGKIMEGYRPSLEGKRFSKIAGIFQKPCRRGSSVFKLAMMEACGHPERHRRRESWQLLKTFKGKSNLDPPVL